MATDLKPIKMIAGMRINRSKYRSSSHEPDTFKIKPIIDEINNKVNRTSISKLFSFINDMTGVVSENLSKIHFKNKDDYKLFRDDKKLFIMKKIFITKDDNILLNSDCYKWINSNMQPDGIRILNGFITNINNNLTEKKKDKPSDIEKFDNLLYSTKLSSFGFNSTEKISYKQIREAYELRKTLISEKGDAMDELNDNFVYLRDNYDQYLSLLLTKIPSL